MEIVQHKASLVAFGINIILTFNYGGYYVKQSKCDDAYNSTVQLIFSTYITFI